MPKITIGNPAHSNIADCYANAFFELLDNNGNVLQQQFVPGSVISNPYDYVDLWDVPVSNFKIRINNISTIAATITSNIVVGSDFPVNNVILNGYAVTVDILATAENISISCLADPILPLSANPCEIRTSAEYLQFLDLIKLDYVVDASQAVDLSGLTRAIIPNNFIFDTGLNWHYPNPFYFKKKVCNPEVQNVEICGSLESSGIGQYVNIIPSNYLSGMPDPIPLNEILPNEDYVKALGSFEYVENKKFTRFQTLADSRIANLNSEGSPGNLKPRGQFTFRIQNTPAALGAVQKLANQRLIVVYQNSSLEKVIMGDLTFPAQITAYNKRLSDEESYIEITVQNGVRMPMYYTGNL